MLLIFALSLLIFSIPRFFSRFLFLYLLFSECSDTCSHILASVIYFATLIFGVLTLFTDELLRTLSIMAGSKPIFLLSLCSILPFTLSILFMTLALDLDCFPLDYQPFAHSLTVFLFFFFHSLSFIL